LKTLENYVILKIIIIKGRNQLYIYFVMDKKELEKHLKQISEIVKNDFKQRGGINLKFYLLTKLSNHEYSLGVFEMPEDLMGQRMAVIKRYGKMLNEKNIKVDAIFSASECWVSTVSTEKNKEIDLDSYVPEIMPRNDPDRKECVVISGMTETKESVFRMYDVEEKETWSNLESKKVLVNAKLPESVVKNKKVEKIKPEAISSPLLEEFWKGLLVPFNVI